MKLDPQWAQRPAMLLQAHSPDLYIDLVDLANRQGQPGELAGRLDELAALVRPHAARVDCGRTVAGVRCLGRCRPCRDAIVAALEHQLAGVDDAAA